MSLFAYLLHEWPVILGLTAQHLAMVLIAVGVAIVVGVPLGVAMIRWPALSRPVLMLATVILTIPSIALFGLMMPFFSAFGQGIGPLPAIAAVFLYSLLPITRNTYLALAGLDVSFKEAGLGIGMTFWQRLYLVDLPMAIPIIFGGVRTAVVLNIGVMTVAALIGAGGLGVLILQAISQSNMQKLIAGSVVVSSLAIAIDLLLGRLQCLLTPEGLRKS